MLTRRFVVSAGTVLALVACTANALPTSAVNDSTFVRTMVELERLQDDTTLDSLMRDSTRRVILRRNGLTATELVQAARAMASDPDRAERVWTAISSARSPGAFRPLNRPATPRPPIHIGTPSRPPTP